jgi:NADH-ubiquinone oxidoreductase chain 5
MLLPVMIVSSLVQLYSLGYMEQDPHLPRFFSYLSLFSFFMLILVTGENLLLLFLGWEGDAYNQRLLLVQNIINLVSLIDVWHIFTISQHPDLFLMVLVPGV